MSTVDLSSVSGLQPSLAAKDSSIADDLPVAEQDRLAQTQAQLKTHIVGRALLVTLISDVTCIVASVVLWSLFPPSHVNVIAALCGTLVLSLSMLVRFETPRGFTNASQLGFVPLMFMVPAAMLPLCYGVAVLIARLPRIVNGTTPANRLLRVPENCWVAVGPAWALALLHPSHATMPILAIAVAAQFAFDFATTSTSLWFSIGVTLKESLQDAWVYAADLALSGVAFAVAVTAGQSVFASLLVVPLLALLALFAHDRSKRFAYLMELNDTYRGTALLLGDVIEADDQYTGLHCQDVVQLALAVSDKLGLDATQRRNTEFAALLHDVGKIAIPKEIINKPGKLTDEEWTLIKTHSAEGEKMLSRIGGFMLQVGRIVRSHHERWDGHGYPDGLVGDQSPIEARIITVCDSWNAMRTDRPYRAAMSIDDASAEIDRNIGSQFDPQVAQALLGVVQSSPPFA